MDLLKVMMESDIWCYLVICNRIKYLKSEKRSITDRINYIFAKIRIDSYNPLAIKKLLTFHNGLILIKSVVNENKNKYYYNIFLEKGSYKDKIDAKYFQNNVYILQMLYFDRIDLDLMLTKQGNQTSAMFVTISIFWIKALSFNWMSAIDVVIY